MELYDWTNRLMSVDHVSDKLSLDKITSWPDFEGRCGEVRTSPEIVLYLPV
jgi:hypothetical protein